MAADSPGPERPRSETPTYVNIPVSPSSRPQLHYMGLEFPGPVLACEVGFHREAPQGICDPSSRHIDPGREPFLPVWASVSHYAQIDITATETAHRVGAQHAQTREERLSELEQWRKGDPQ